MSDVSIIIVTYNSADVIKTCLSRIRDNAYSLQVEVILVDNNSQDDTLAVVEQFSRDIQGTLILHIIRNQKNIGYAPAVNQGLRKMNSNIVILLNPDVFLTDNFLSKVCSFLTRDTIGFIAPQHLALDNTVVPSCREFPDYLTFVWDITGLSRLLKNSEIFGKWRMGYFDHTYRRDVDQPMGACLIAKKETIDLIGQMDEQFVMFFSDVDWCKRCEVNNLKRIFEPDLKVHHIVGHSIQQKKQRMILSSHYAYFLYLRKYFTKWWQQILNYIFGVLLLITALLRIVFSILKHR